LLGRLGIPALGSSGLIVFILGIFALALGVTLQAGAHGCRHGDKNERNAHGSAAFEWGPGEQMLRTDLLASIAGVRPNSTQRSSTVLLSGASGSQH
jgi:hypothetical protein